MKGPASAGPMLEEKEVKPDLCSRGGRRPQHPGEIRGVPAAEDVWIRTCWLEGCIYECTRATCPSGR